jgi:hypothetical protein
LPSASAKEILQDLPVAPFNSILREPCDGLAEISRRAGSAFGGKLDLDKLR